MPIEDTIFKRIRIARDAEVAALARILGETSSVSREDDITDLSRALRSAGGNSIANAFRSDHDLPYLEILRDRAKHVASQNNWGAPHQIVSPPDEATAEIWVENYIAEAATASAQRARGQLDDEGLRQAQVRAQAAMNGEPPPADDLGVVGWATIALLSPLVVVAGLVLAITDPGEEKMLRAVLVLIHIRRRHETAERVHLACGRTP